MLSSVTIPLLVGTALDRRGERLARVDAFRLPARRFPAGAGVLVVARAAHQAGEIGTRVEEQARAEAHVAADGEGATKLVEVPAAAAEVVEQLDDSPRARLDRVCDGVDNALGRARLLPERHLPGHDHEDQAERERDLAGNRH